MSRLDEPTDTAFLVYVAGMTIDSHNAGHRCQCCTPDGCPPNDWARQTSPSTRPPPAIDRPACP